MAQIRKRKGTVASLRPVGSFRSSLSFSSPASPGFPCFTGPSEDHSPLYPAGTTPLSDLYQLLKLAITAGPVALEIPETLVMLKGGREILFFNDDKKLIKLYEAKDVLSQFFTQCLHRTHEDHYETPFAFFRSESTGVKVLFTVEDAEAAWKDTRDSTKMMQKYIVSGSGEAEKVRIIWRRDGDIQRFKMHKRGSGSLRSGRRLPRS